MKKAFALLPQWEDDVMKFLLNFYWQEENTLKIASAFKLLFQKKLLIFHETYENLIFTGVFIFHRLT